LTGLGIQVQHESSDQLLHLLGRQRLSPVAGDRFAQARQKLIDRHPFAFQWEAQVDEWPRQVGQRPVQVGAARPPDPLFDLGQHHRAEGVADQRLDQRRALTDVAGQGEARLQRGVGLVVLAVVQLEAGPQCQQPADWPQRLNFRMHHAEALLAEALGQFPVAVGSSGTAVHLLEVAGGLHPLEL
jgi:hypothetical protein